MYAIRSYYVPFSKKHTESWESHGANIDCNDTMHNYGYRDVHELHKKHKISRITSYNVCYTKLLRAIKKSYV